MPADERVTRSTLSDRIRPVSVPRPMPRLPRRIWSDQDWERIRRGYEARDMEERWDVFTEGRVVFVHRSWTGYGIYAATFAPVDGGWRIADAVVERDPERYGGTDDAYDRVMLELVISAVVLGEPVPELRSELVELMRRQSHYAGAPHSTSGPGADS
ncbi:hypothetical protein [Streptomyces pactum]|uniref:hypothetical protein n=1 Tax=Streptomyces pactum TaxID=68249 RepID=UPI0036FF499C